jgi:hypothetical protein
MYLGIREQAQRENQNPGSAEAVKAGCTCDVSENRNGRGVLCDSGIRVFRSDDDCPLHGFEAAFGAVKEAVTRAARSSIPKMFMLAHSVTAMLVSL